MNRFSARQWLLASATSLTALGLAAPAFAADAAAANTADNAPITNADDIVVTATKVNAATPITASVHTFEPQAIVSRSIIEDSVPATADFTTIASLTPGASLVDTGAGPGLGETKLVLRGFQDGQYNITYDGIPFGDSNDPTHHSTSYFPDGTYERIIVDRGPGGATDLGQASYGGNVHLVSRELSDKFFVEGQGAYGSWNTYLLRGTVNSGRISKLGDLKIIAVGEYKQSDTALTGSKGWYANSFVKLEKPLGPDAKLTVLSSYNQNFIHQADGAGGATCTAGSIAGASVNGPYPETDGKNCAAGSQVATYGKQFALVDSSMLASSMWPGLRSDWNWQRKVTDFEEARLQWNINDHISIDNKAYTYFYKNFTVSTDATTLKATGKANESFYGVTPCALTYGGTQCWASATQAVTGTFLTPSSAAGGYGYTNDASLNGHMPGYTKLNQYRQIGDILEMTIKTSAGIGKLGFWYEHSRSHRYQYDYDFTAGAAAGGLSDGTFNFNIMNQNYDYNVADKSYNTMSNGQYVPSYIKYDERTGWENYQVFGEFALKLLDDTLTLTPGVKVTSYSRTINTPIASQSSRSSQFNHDNYKPVLPYFTANYLLKPNWSFYGQYAKGFLMPSLGNSLESVVQNPTTGAITCPSSGCNLQPTKTKNYQLGTVYAGDRVNVDADVYYIQTSNSTSVDPSTNQAVQTAGPAEYQGVEGQISYVLMHGLTAIANGALMSSKDKTTHLWLSQSPNYVATLGAVYGGSRFKLSYLHKFTGRQFADTAQLYRIAPYTKGTLSAAFKLGPAWLGVSVDNVFNDTSVTKLGSSSSTTSPATSAPNTALPVAYYYQSPRSYQVNLKVRY